MENGTVTDDPREKRRRAKESKRKYEPYKEIIGDFLVEKIHQAEGGLAKLREAETITDAEWVRNNRVYWEAVLSGLWWALAGVDKQRGKRGSAHH